MIIKRKGLVKNDTDIASWGGWDIRFPDGNTINTDLVVIANGNDHYELCFAVVYHQPMLDHPYAYFLNTGPYFLWSHFLIICVGDIDI